MKVEQLLENIDDRELYERVERQFRRYGDRFKRQYRCKSGPKKGKIVSSPESCGRRKSPERIRTGRKSARSKKGQRKRKTRMTKRLAPHKRLVRMNKVMRGDK